MNASILPAERRLKSRCPSHATVWYRCSFFVHLKNSIRNRRKIYRSTFNTLVLKSNVSTICCYLTQYMPFTGNIRRERGHFTYLIPLSSQLQYGLLLLIPQQSETFVTQQHCILCLRSRFFVESKSLFNNSQNNNETFCIVRTSYISSITILNGCEYRMRKSEIKDKFHHRQRY